MKKLFFALMTMLTVSISVNAMSYEQARNEALFLTDKMAYELNLTDEQYEAAYEINLDYLMGVTGRDNVFGTYWERRNLDLSYILLDWQWNAFVAATYFYRPLYWDAGYWHFGIYARYPYRDYFYFGRPHFYVTYRGAHAWHRVGGPGYYHGHRDHFRPPHREHFGMHDRWNRGDFRGPGHHHSSTRVTGHNNGPHRNGPSGSGNFHGRRNRGDYSGGGNFDRNRHNGGNGGGGNVGGGNFNGHRSNSARYEGSTNRAQRQIGQTRPVDRGRSVDFSSSRGSSTRSTVSHSGSGSFSRSGSRSGGSSFSGGSASFGGGSSRGSSSFSHGGGSHGSFSHSGGSHGGGSFSHGGGSHGGGSHGGHGGMGGRR